MRNEAILSYQFKIKNTKEILKIIFDFFSHSICKTKKKLLLIDYLLIIILINDLLFFTFLFFPFLYKNLKMKV